MPSSIERRGVLPHRLRHLDLVLVGAVLALAAIGLVAVYSATRGELLDAGLDPALYLKRQAVWVVVGVVLAGAVVAVPVERLRRTAGLWYVGSLVLLALVATPLGITANGAQRWLDLGPFQLQPAEFAEVALIGILAAWCARGGEVLGGRRLVGAVVLGVVPAAMVLRQPNLGSAAVFAVVVVVVLFAAGARVRAMVALGAGAAAVVTAVLGLGLLHDYQAERLTGFVNPGGGSASVYNLRQAQVAIGAGGLTGAGLFQGTQTNLSFVPEQSTDFIFTVIGEELGFVGTTTVVVLFALVAWRVLRAAAVARDRFGSLLCVGVLALLVFKVFQNIGMAVEMMPITGIPLPFLSYGGSATIASFVAVGAVLDVGVRRFG